MPQKEKKKEKKKLKLTYKLYIAFWAFSVTIFAGVILMQMERIQSYKDEELTLAKKIEAEKKTGDDLRRQLEFYESDAYIEKIAREQLGLVMLDEIIFRNNPSVK